MKLLRRNYRVLVSLCALALAGVFVASCGSTSTATTIPTPARATIPTSSAPDGDTGDLKRTNQGGSVTMEVTWEKGVAPASLQFKVVMDTHSVDLDGIDLMKLAALRNDAGKEVSPERWDAPAGGHHRAGTIVFPATTGGSSLIEPQTKFIELIVRDVAGVKERSFKWTASS